MIKNKNIEKQQNTKEYTLLVSTSYGNKSEKGTLEIAIRPWLVRELDAESISVPREASLLLGEALPLVGEALRLVGDSLGVTGDALCLVGDGLRLVGDALRLTGDALRLTGDALRLVGDARTFGL